MPQADLAAADVARRVLLLLRALRDDRGGDRARGLLARLAEDERTDRLIVNELKATMAETGVLVAPGARVTWAATKGRTKTDWHAVAQMLKGDMPA